MNNIMAMLQDLASRMPAPEPLDPIQEATPFPTCIKCRTFNVSMPGDLCEQCTREQSQGYEALQLLGRLANGGERDHGSLYHALPLNENWRGTAICGAKPSGRRSVGWTFDPLQHGKNVTCPRCLKILKRYADPANENGS